MQLIFKEWRGGISEQCMESHELIDGSQNELEHHTSPEAGTQIFQTSEAQGYFNYSIKDFETPLYGYNYQKCEPLAILDGPWNEFSFVKHGCEELTGDCLVSWGQ